jgi:hypothetical protein
MTVCLWTASGAAGSWAHGDVPVPGTAVYAHRPLDAELAARINPERTLADLLEEVQEIGYPVT